MGFHRPPEGKAKKSDGFWRCAGSPKILVHLTSPRGNGGCAEGGQEKEKKTPTSLLQTGENEGKQAGADKLERG